MQWAEAQKALVRADQSTDCIGYQTVIVIRPLIADVAVGGSVEGGIVVDEELFMEEVQVDEDLFDVEEDELGADDDGDGDSDDYSLR